MRKILLPLLLLLSLFANAYTAQIDGIYYTIYRTQASVTYRNNEYNSYSGDVVIPESVTYNNKTYNVTSIGSNAFYGCTGLTSVTIPKHVKSIENNAFQGCTGLTSVTLNSDAIVSASRTSSTSMKTIFGNQVTKYVIGNTVQSIGNRAFGDCSELTSVTIPESVFSIGANAFSYCI